MLGWITSIIFGKNNNLACDSGRRKHGTLFLAYLGLIGIDIDDLMDDIYIYLL